jgi:hypothetical protein
MSKETGNAVKNRYRAVVMIPTEMYIEGVDAEDAYASIDWLFEQYPEVDAPVSDQSEARGPIMPRVMTIENV